jgi:hypothetical protein
MCFFYQLISILGTIKIENNCTSTIKIKEDKTGAVSVELCSTHYGHETELQHIWLTQR